MTTMKFHRQEVISIDNKKRRRQSQPHRRQVVGNDVVLSIVPSLFILLLLSGSHLPKFDAFQFRSIYKNHFSNKPSMTQSMGKSPATTNCAFLRLRRRTRQNNNQNQNQYQNHYHSDCNNVLSLHSQSINSRSESESSNSTEPIGTEKTASSNGPPLSSSSILEAANEEQPSPGVVSTNIAEANALRAQAGELRAEARAMELELRQRATNKRREKDEITDEMIASVFLPLQYQEPTSSSDQSTATAASTAATAKETTTATASTTTATIPDARVVADRLRKGKFSRQQIISVVDRLYDQHHDTKEQEEGGVTAVTNNSELQRLGEDEEDHLTQEQQGVDDGETTIRSDNGQYSDYFQVLVQAAILLDQSIVANTLFEETTKTATTSTTIQTATISPEPSSSASPPPVPASSSSPSSLSSFNFSSSTSSSSSSSVPSPMPFVTSGHIGKAIQSRIGELRQLKQAELNRKIAAETNRIATMSSSSPSGWSPQYSGSANNGTSTGDLSGDTPSFIPLWIPSAYIPYVLSLDKSMRTQSSTSPSASKVATTNATTPVVPYAVIRNSTLESAELEILKNKVLLESRFYMTSFEFAPGAALFRGNIRTSLGNVPTVVPSIETSKKNNNTHTKNKNNNTAMVFDDIQKRLEAAGLGDKVQLFVLPDPEAALLVEPSSRRPATMSMGMRWPSIDAAALPPDDEKSVILALPKQLTPDESKLKKGWIRKIGKRLSYPVAALSTFFYSVKTFALNPIFFDALVNKRDATVLCSCIPLTLGFLLVQLIHEIAHYLVAKRKKINIGFPVPVSTMFYSNLPFFGCITPLRSFPPNRAALVDFALSGPMVSLAVSLCMVFGGALLTSSASAVQIARFPFLSVHTMKSNFLLGSILSWLLPKTMMLPLAQPIPMHPLFVVGRFGMISSALNLLPIFRLDGGRACFAAMGQRQGAVISAFTILWIISNFFMSSSMLLVWTLMVALFQMRVEIPCRDECTEVGGKREWLWLISFMLSVSILIPFPHHGSFL